MLFCSTVLQFQYENLDCTRDIGYRISTFKEIKSTTEKCPTCDVDKFNIPCSELSMPAIWTLE